MVNGGTDSVRDKVQAFSPGRGGMMLFFFPLLSLILWPVYTSESKKASMIYPIQTCSTLSHYNLIYIILK